MGWDSLSKMIQDGQKYAKIKSWIYKWFKQQSKWGGIHKNQFISIDIFSIKATFSRTLREVGKSEYLTRGSYKRGRKAAKGQWKVSCPWQWSWIWVLIHTYGITVLKIYIYIYIYIYYFSMSKFQHYKMSIISVEIFLFYYGYYWQNL